MIKKNPKYSKRINYDALKDLFVDAGDEKDNATLYTIEPQTSVGEGGEGIGMEVIEEEGGAVGVGAVHTETKIVGGEDMDANADDEDAYGEEDASEKGDDVINPGWEDVYEQEV